MCNDNSIHSKPGKEIRRHFMVNKQKSKPPLVKELCEAKCTDLGKLTNKLIMKLKANNKVKMDSLNARHIRENMNRNQRRIWRPELEKLQVNRRCKKEVKETIVLSPKDKATGKNELLVEALQADPEAMIDPPGKSMGEVWGPGIPGQKMDGGRAHLNILKK